MELLIHALIPKLVELISVSNGGTFIIWIASHSPSLQIILTYVQEHQVDDRWALSEAMAVR